jgi:2'-5' RNA ligase
LFFAVYPQPSLRRQLAAMAEQLAQGCGGRPIAADNIHLTLSFLGNVDDSVCQCVRAVGDAIHARPFELLIDRLGYWRRPRIIWAGSSQTPAALMDLVSCLRTGVEDQCGIVADERPYRVHLTLLRKVAGADRQGSRLDAPLTVAVSNFVLMESVSAAGGVRYLPLYDWPL